MGADASAYLYLAVKFEDVYERKQEVTEYDIHDQKTGKKTGKKGTDTVKYFLNKYTGKRYDLTEPRHISEEDDAELQESNILQMEQESDNYYIGVQVASAGWRGSMAKVPENRLAEARAEFEQKIRPILGDSGLQPELVLNLYWSY